MDSVRRRPGRAQDARSIGEVIARIVEKVSAGQGMGARPAT